MTKSDAIDGLHGALIAVPLVAFAIPGVHGLFAGAPDTVALGTGAAALAALPVAVLAAVRGRASEAFGLAPLMVLLAVAAVSIGAADDSFGLWRALVALAAALGFVMGGASLGATGRTVVQRGFVALGLLLLATVPMTPGGASVLGNSGDLSEALLPCAVLGAGVFLGSSGLLAFLGFALLFTSAVAFGLIPVYAGVLGLGAGATAALGASALGKSGGEYGRRQAAQRGRILLIAVLVAVAPIGFRAATEGASNASRPAGVSEADAEGSEGERGEAIPIAPAAARTTGGIRFRTLTWARIPNIVRDHGALGVGPGQFQAAFPPYRDPAEIELSSFDRQEPTPIEVEHAHNDFLTALTEYGFLGGGAFLLFLVIVVGRALLQLASADSTQRDFALAALAVAANATVNSPLLYGVLAPAVAFTVFGVVMAPPLQAASVDGDEDGPPPRAIARYAAPGLAVVILLLLVPKAWSLVQYGRALGQVESARVVTPDGREGLDAARLGRILDRAAAHAPSSPIVLEKRAQVLRREGADPDLEQRILGRWLEARPHSLAARLARGSLAARRGDFETAAAEYEAAFQIDPGHPALLRNRIRVGCDLRNPERVRTALGDAVRAGHASADWVRKMAIEELLEGRLDVAQPLVDRMLAGADSEAVSTLDPDDCFAASGRAEQAGDAELERAFRVAFQMNMALDHLRRNAPGSAATSARQAYQRASSAIELRGLDNGPIRLRLAAARAANGELDLARERLAEGPLRPADGRALDPVEREALERAGLLSPEAAAEK